MICPNCKGEGEIMHNPGYPDPQTETWDRCDRCSGTGKIPDWKAALPDERDAHRERLRQQEFDLAEEELQRREDA